MPPVITPKLLRELAAVPPDFGDRILQELGDRVFEDNILSALVIVSLCKKKGVPLETIVGMMEATIANNERFEWHALGRAAVVEAVRIVDEAQNE